jgi:hypothetical protein
VPSGIAALTTYDFKQSSMIHLITANRKDFQQPSPDALSITSNTREPEPEILLSFPVLIAII